MLIDNVTLGVGVMLIDEHNTYSYPNVVLGDGVVDGITPDIEIEGVGDDEGHKTYS
jgi:hypothetical protein